MVGTDYTRAPLAVRERLAIGGEAIGTLIRRLTAEDTIAEAVVLSTCNRTELYLAVSDATVAGERARRAVEEVAGIDRIDGLLIRRDGIAAVRHLCAVASGLESMVVAEGQILGQVREAIEVAQRLGAAGTHLAAVFRAAIACGKRVRTETALGRVDASVSSVLIDLLAGQFADWSQQRVLLIGAGRMNQITSERLRALGAGRIAIASRTLGAAERTARAVEGTAIPIERVGEAARRATLIISATRSPEVMLTAEMLNGRVDTPLRVVDLAVPRDVDPAVGGLPGVHLLDIDDLRDLQDQHGFGEALVAARRIVDQASEDWQVWCRTREAVPLIADLRAHVDRQKEAELERTMARLAHLPEAEQAEVSEMAHRLVNKMFHHLATRMKQAAADPEHGEQYLRTARYLFQRDESRAHTPEPESEGTRSGADGAAITG